MVFPALQKNARLNQQTETLLPVSIHDDMRSRLNRRHSQRLLRKNPTRSISLCTAEKEQSGILRTDLWKYSDITSVTMEDVYSIDGSVFLGSAFLHSVTLPSCLTVIGQSAFENCTNLESITIPSSVRYLCEDAFCGCSSLKDIYYEGTREQWNNVSKAMHATHLQMYLAEYDVTLGKGDLSFLYCHQVHLPDSRSSYLLTDRFTKHNTQKTYRKKNRQNLRCRKKNGDFLPC